MSKRKKTTTTKNNHKKNNYSFIDNPSKEMVLENLEQTDEQQLSRFGNEQGLIGVMFRFVHEDFPQKNICGKAILRMEQALGSSKKWVEENGIEMHNEIPVDIASLGNNYHILKQKNELTHERSIEISSSIINAFCLYLFYKRNLIVKCEENINNRVGIIINFELMYDEEDGDYNSAISVRYFDNINDWFDEGNRIIVNDASARSRLTIME